MTLPAGAEPDLDAELDRRCIEDGEALSDLLTFYVYMIGVNLIDDTDTETEVPASDR